MDKLPSSWIRQKLLGSRIDSQDVKILARIIITGEIPCIVPYVATRGYGQRNMIIMENQ
jgi:hypothetical protein